MKNTIHSEIDFASSIPLHHQLKEKLKSKIINGELLDRNLKIPSEVDLINNYGVSRITVRKAIQTLVDEGILYRQRGKGTFLTKNTMESWTGKLMGFSETMRDKGLEVNSKVLDFGKTSILPIKVKNELKTDKGWKLERLRSANGIPIAIELSIFPVEIGKELEKQDLNNLLTYNFIEGNLGIFLSHGNQEISTVKASTEQANLLDMEEADPLLFMRRTSYSFQNKPIEYLESVYNPNYFSYNIDLIR